MGVKKFGLGLSLLLLIGLSGLIFYKLKELNLPAQVAPQNDLVEIIAPAVVDSLNDVLRIPALQSGIIENINVFLGQQVKKGQVLFSLNDTAAQDNLMLRKLALEQAKSDYIIQAKKLKRVSEQLEQMESLDKRMIKYSDLLDKRYELKMSKIQLKQAKNNVHKSEVNLKQIETTLKQYTTVSPKDGVVLKIIAKMYEFVGGAQQVILLGDAKKVIVRVSIDENDIGNFSPKAAAYLMDNENKKMKIPLTFLQLEQYIIKEEYLNSRVLEAVYYFNRQDFPNIIAGRRMDAHIMLTSKKMIQ